MQINYIFLLQKNEKVCLLVVWIAILTILMIGESCLQADTSKAVDNIVRQALTERFISGRQNLSLQENRIPQGNIRTIVQNNLDPGLLTSLMETNGIDFRFFQSRQNVEAQVAILILSYPNKETVHFMIKQLSNMNGYFKHTKILTRFSCSSLDNQLVIAFTENAGDKDVTNFINELSELFNVMQ